MTDRTETDPLSATFAALADPTRRAILARLAEGAANVGELARPFDISAPAISRHLKVLEEAKLIARRKQGQYRVCRLQPDRLKTLSRWIDRYRVFWEGQLDALSDYLDEVQDTE